MSAEMRAQRSNEKDKTVGQVAADQEVRFYEVMSASPRTAAELAALTGSSEQLVGQWLVTQVAGNRLVQDGPTGGYANWCAWPRS